MEVVCDGKKCKMSMEHGKLQRSNKVLQDGQDDVEKTDQAKNTDDEKSINDGLMERNAILSQRNKNLKSTNEKLENEISKTKRKEAECLKKNDELEMRNKELERDKQDLERKIKELQKEIENLKKMVMINDESQYFQVMTASVDSGIDDWDIVEKSDIEQEENTHLQNSFFSSLSDTTGSVVTSLSNAADDCDPACQKRRNSVGKRPNF